jgi:hypothetical protein
VFQKYLGRRVRSRPTGAEALIFHLALAARLKAVPFQSLFLKHALALQREEAKPQELPEADASLREVC